MTDASKVLVTGGRGALGRQVVDRLRGGGCSVWVLSRSEDPGTLRGDLLSGEGLEEAVQDTYTIVHCASNPSRRTRQTDVGGTQRLLRVAKQGGASHFVYISIVGVDRNPFPYYRAKLDAERLVESSGVPWTILRATQFHHLVFGVLRFLNVCPSCPSPKASSCSL